MKPSPETDPAPQRPTLVLSPHVDDAVFACGRLLAYVPAATVHTIFAGRPPPEPRLTEWDWSSGFRSGDDVVGARREEDLAALGLLGATALWLDVRDRQYGPPPAPEAIWHIAYVPELVAHHHPSPRRDSAGWRHLLLRNAIWCAWLRRPAGDALCETVQRMWRARGESFWAGSLVAALGGGCPGCSGTGAWCRRMSKPLSAAAIPAGDRPEEALRSTRATVNISPQHRVSTAAGLGTWIAMYCSWEGCHEWAFTAPG